jgi:tetratricopeptide (TPR) repeat protein
MAKSRWNTIRLVVLVSILIPLAIFGFFRNRYTTQIARIHKSLESREDLRAIDELRELERFNGLTAESCFLRARAYRHLRDDIAFAQFIELARQLGLPKEQVENEKLLRATQVGDVPDLNTAIANAMASPDVELDELGPAVVYAFLGRRQFEQADAFLKFWQQQDGKTPWEPLFRGMVSIATNNWEEAIKALESGVTDHPDFTPYYKHLGVVYHKKRDYGKAVSSLKRFLASSPDELESVAALATTLVDADRSDEAIQLLQPLVENGSATTEMRIVLARIYLSKSEPAKVIDVLGSTARLWPEDVVVANLLSQANQAAGNEEAADGYAKIAQAGQGDVQSITDRVAKIFSGSDASAQKMYELGHIYLHKQSREDGVYWLNAALAADETLIAAHEDMVTYFTRTNQTELATSHQQFISALRGNR